MESCRVCNRLDVIRRGQVIIASGDCGKMAHTQTLHSLGKLESGIQIGVLIVDAVTRIPTGVHSELHQVCEPSNLLSACSFAAEEGAKLIQIDWLRAFRSQICVNDIKVGDLVVV